MRIKIFSSTEKPKDSTKSSSAATLVVKIQTESNREGKQKKDVNQDLGHLGPSQKTAKSIQEKADLLDYVMREDGSVLCKICGEILSSRTHWYRHKYKIHSPISAPGSHPSALFQCEQCSAFFKSRKGYIGHLASRHSSTQEISVRSVKQEDGPEKITRGEILMDSLDESSWEEQRKRDEELVAEIIKRVRRECEAQGAAIGRRGYNRRTTIMNSS
ncbi:uncharacterized protein LOC129792833 [Lutzomyia longipalpis]|uniref:uncharacterized protein LOC129792833 n=1 Tax=Lutzomyia longipalpis TaxID=7200 RepID=UPI0024833A82|nr:uncharacterized protein LOC129792833 [Lutzomyia longipalpis]